MKRKNVKVFELAVQMAESGQFKNWKAIEDELVSQGHRRAPNLLDGDKIRAILDIQCERNGGNHKR